MSAQEKNEILESIKQYIYIIDSNLINIIEEVRENHFSNSLVDLLDNLTYCFRGLNLTSDIHNIEVDEEFFKEKVREMLEAMENEDFNLIADILEYEISEMIEDLNLKLESIN